MIGLPHYVHSEIELQDASSMESVIIFLLTNFATMCPKIFVSQYFFNFLKIELIEILQRLVTNESISFFVVITGNQHKTRGRKTFGFDWDSHGCKGIHNNILHFLPIFDLISISISILNHITDFH